MCVRGHYSCINDELVCSGMCWAGRCVSAGDILFLGPRQLYVLVVVIDDVWQSLFCRRVWLCVYVYG